MCHICGIHYNYILNIDNFNEELKNVSEILGFKLENVRVANKAISKNDKVRNEAIKSLTREAFDLFLERYSDDYELFNMNKPTFEEIKQIKF